LGRATRTWRFLSPADKQKNKQKQRTEETNKKATQKKRGIKESVPGKDFLQRPARIVMFVRQSDYSTSSKSPFSPGPTLRPGERAPLTNLARGEGLLPFSSGIPPNLLLPLARATFLLFTIPAVRQNLYFSGETIEQQNNET
jgi:hypothetical protein